MKLIALEIPDDATDLANWLEGHLVGLDLSTVVAQLDVVHGFNDAPAKSRPRLVVNLRRDHPRQTA